MQPVLGHEDYDVTLGADLEHHSCVGGDLVSAVLGVIKGMVGPAILYLPHGFAGSGYLTAMPILIIATGMFLHSSRCLLNCWEMERSKEESLTYFLLTTEGQRRRMSLSYPELAFRALGPKGETIVKIGIALMQSGVCITYFIFVPQNLTTSCSLLLGVNIPRLVWLLAMIPGFEIYESLPSQTFSPMYSFFMGLLFV